jgi:hypothetical protein
VETLGTFEKEDPSDVAHGTQANKEAAKKAAAL